MIGAAERPATHDGRAATPRHRPQAPGSTLVRLLRRAQPTAMRASEIRALFAVASRPEVVSLAGGMPLHRRPPARRRSPRRSQRAPSRARRRRPSSTAPVRATRPCASRSSRSCDLEGIDAHPDDVVVTTGSQQALDLVTQDLHRPGRRRRRRGPVVRRRARGLPLLPGRRRPRADGRATGLIPEALDETLARAARGRDARVKFLYTVPNFHNPAGVSPLARAPPAILEIAPRHGVLVLEDNPYGLLGFDGEPPPAHAVDERRRA